MTQRITIVLVVWLAGVALAGPVDAQSRYEQYSGFRVDETAVLPGQEVHPSLYFHAGDLEALRARRTDPAYAYAWQQVRGDAASYLSRDPASMDENDRPRMAKTLAFWWLMEGSEDARDKAISALMLAFDGVPQTGDKPYDEIYRATWLQNYCAAYDWVRDQLTDTQNADIRARIAAETDYLRHNLTDGERLAPRPHNHRSKPAWAIGTAALTLSDDPRAADWLSYALWSANTVTWYQFSEDGIYREGGHYWMYNAVNFIPFLWHYLNVSGVDLFPTYRPAFEWPVRVRTSRGMIPNFEDSYLKPAPTHMVAAAYAGAPTDFHSSAPLDEILQWNFLSAELISTNYTGATADVTWEIDEFILYDATIPATMPDRRPNVLLRSGQVVFRNGWDRGSRSLVFHGVAEADNHNHPDQLSYVLESDDAILIADAGYGPDGFSDPRRDSWYLTNKAHNVVTADGYAPRGTQLDQQPESPNYIDADGFGFADKRSFYGPLSNTSQLRAIAFIAERYYVVADVLEADASHTYRSYLHGRGAFDSDGNHLMWTTYPDKYGVPVRLDAFLLPTSSSVERGDGWVSLFKDGRLEKYADVTLTGEDVTLLHILVPGLPGSPSPDVQDLSSDPVSAATVAIGDSVDTILVQPEPSARVVADLETDGTFAWRRVVASELRAGAVRDGTSWSSPGALSLTASLPVTVAFDISDPAVLVLTTGAMPPVVELRLSGPAITAVQSVVVDGSNAGFERDGDDIQVVITTSTARAPIPELPGMPLRLHAYPNPFSSHVTLSIDDHPDSTARIEIFDALGRRVRTLPLGRSAGNAGELRWDGRNDAGSLVSSGPYFARIATDSAVGPATSLVYRD